MDEQEVADAMIAQLKLTNLHNWEQPGYKPSLFDIFLNSQRNENGTPLLSGDIVRDGVREQLGDEITKDPEFEKMLDLVCEAWNEWKYAVENWPTP